MSEPTSPAEKYLHGLRELRFLHRAGRHNAPQTEALRDWLALAWADLTDAGRAEVWRLISLEDER